jgi:hypothetical protein
MRARLTGQPTPGYGMWGCFGCMLSAQPPFRLNLGKVCRVLVSSIAAGRTLCLSVFTASAALLHVHVHAQLIGKGLTTQLPKWLAGTSRSTACLLSQQACALHCGDCTNMCHCIMHCTALGASCTAQGAAGAHQSPRVSC